MRLTRLTYTIIAITVIFCSCVKPFSPAVTTVNQNILVVEGLINTGGDTTKVNLSHTVTIGNKNSSVAETGAAVTVEDAVGGSYPVPETKIKGSYASNGALALTSGKQYRLRIKTSGGKTYLSDLVEAKAAPPIDSLGYTFTGNGIKFYINCHDDAGKSLYYKYAFSETWQFHSSLASGFYSNGKDAALPRSASQMIFYCFNKDSSTNIILNSTAALSKDAVYHYFFNAQSDTLEKFQLRYSILVSQQTLTKDGYAFWQNMKKNTQELGSIFDAQPSAISGNIHNVNNATEPVIGFISAGTVQRKRIYINKRDLPSNFVASDPAKNCQAIPAADVDSVKSPLTQPPYWAYFYIIRLPSPNRILTADLPTGPFTYASAICADCTVRGTTTTPSFWKP